MTTPDTHDPECTTTTPFDDHGLADGEALIRGTHYRLLDAGVTEFEPTSSFFDRLESAFVWAYLSSTEERSVPPQVEAAIDDARALTRAAFASDGQADLRTEVIPAFYQRVAGFHCVYRE